MIDLKIKSMEPATRHFIVEAGDGFIVQVLDPLPEHLKIGDTLSVDEDVWQQWKDYWKEGPSEMTLEWFEMADLKKHRFANKVWIPLHAEQTLSATGMPGHVGFNEEYFGARALIAPSDQKKAALDLDWTDVMGGSGDKPWVDRDNNFRSASDYDENELKGSLPVLVQYIEVERTHDLHINQDIVLALGLKRKGDLWVRPEEDNVEVIRLIRDSKSQPVRLEMKAEFLKEYLCAVNAGLILVTYQSRRAINESFKKLEREHDETNADSSSYEWKGAVREVFEGNSLLDMLGQAMVLHSWRTDTDYEEDIPSYEFPGATASQSYEAKSSSRKVSQASGEIWKKEWIDPAGTSPRIRHDKTSSRLEFIVDNNGSRETSDTLAGPSSRWLWFHPEVINSLLKKPNGVLAWYSESTGNVGGAWNRSVHFGVNGIGLINVYAKDIALLPEIDKKTWANHNVSPDGKVSDELQMSQMQTNPASTEAPETVFIRLIEEIQKVSKAKFGRELLRHHSSSEEISKKIHRFEASTLDGFYSLCKEITRYLIERIDVDLLKELKRDDPKVGSLKRLEHVLTALGYDGRKLLGVLVGVYELRLADAHLPSSSDIGDAMELVGIDCGDLKFNAGKRLLQNINAALVQVKEALEKGDLTKLSA